LPLVVSRRFQVGGVITGQPAYGPDGSVYVGAHDGVLYALDRQLELRWKRDLGAPIFGGVLLAPDGTLYVGTDGKLLWSFDRDGNFLSRRALEAPIETTPVWSPRGQVIVAAGSELVALNSDGKVGFRARAWGKFFASPVVDDDGDVYAGSQDGNFYAFAPDGAERYRVHPGPAIDAEPVLGPEKRAYFADTLGRVHAIDEWGEISWVVDLGTPVRAPLARGPGATLLVLTQGPRVCLFVLHMLQGTVLAKHVLALTDSEDSGARGGVSVDGTGRVWLGGPDDRVWIFSSFAGPAQTVALPASLAARPWIGASANVLLTERTGEIVLGRLGVNRSLLRGARSL